MSLKDDVEKLKEQDLKNQIKEAENRGYIKCFKDYTVKLIAFCTFFGAVITTLANWAGTMAYEHIPPVRIGYEAFKAAMRGRE